MASPSSLPGRRRASKARGSDRLHRPDLRPPSALWMQPPANGRARTTDAVHQGLKAKKWPVAGIDLGDIYPDKASFLDQGLLRYKTTMKPSRRWATSRSVWGRPSSMPKSSCSGRIRLGGPETAVSARGEFAGGLGRKGIPLKARFQTGRTQSAHDRHRGSGPGRTGEGWCGRHRRPSRLRRKSRPKSGTQA